MPDSVDHQRQPLSFLHSLCRIGVYPPPFLKKSQLLFPAFSRRACKP